MTTLAERLTPVEIIGKWNAQRLLTAYTRGEFAAFTHNDGLRLAEQLAMIPGVYVKSRSFSDSEDSSEARYVIGVKGVNITVVVFSFNKTEQTLIGIDETSRPFGLWTSLYNFYRIGYQPRRSYVLTEPEFKGLAGDVMAAFAQVKETRG